MLFLTYWFVTFACVFFVAYSFIRRPFLRLLLLIGSCVIFLLHFSGPAGVLPIFLLAILTYLCGLVGGKLATTIGITASVLTLATYKYLTFLAQTARSVSPAINRGASGGCDRGLPARPSPARNQLLCLRALPLPLRRETRPAAATVPACVCRLRVVLADPRRWRAESPRAWLREMKSARPRLLLSIGFGVAIGVLFHFIRELRVAKHGVEI